MENKNTTTELINLVPPYPVYLSSQFPYVRIQTGTLAFIERSLPNAEILKVDHYSVFDSPYYGVFGHIENTPTIYNSNILGFKGGVAPIKIINSMISYLWERVDSFYFEDIEIIFEAIKDAGLSIRITGDLHSIPVFVEIEKRGRKEKFHLWNQDDIDNLWFRTESGTYEENVEQLRSFCKIYKETLMTKLVSPHESVYKLSLVLAEEGLANKTSEKQKQEKKALLESLNADMLCY